MLALLLSLWLCCQAILTGHSQAPPEDPNLTIHIGDDIENIEHEVVDICRDRQLKASCKEVFDDVLHFILTDPSRNGLGKQFSLIEKYKSFIDDLYPPLEPCDRDCTSSLLMRTNNAANWESLSSEPFAVLAAHYAEDLSWIREIHSSIPFIIGSKTITENTLYIDKNVGNEILAYLTYIIKYYDGGLPEYTLFLHGSSCTHFLYCTVIHTIHIMQTLYTHYTQIIHKLYHTIHFLQVTIKTGTNFTQSHTLSIAWLLILYPARHIRQRRIAAF